MNGFSARKAASIHLKPNKKQKITSLSSQTILMQTYLAKKEQLCFLQLKARKQDSNFTMRKFASSKEELSVLPVAQRAKFGFNSPIWKYTSLMEIVNSHLSK